MLFRSRELGVTVSDADVMAYYTNHPADFEEPEKVHVRHILLLTENPATQGPLPDDQIKAKRKQIDDILKRARGGEDFAKLATEYSEDPGSKDNGGELPPFSRASADPYHAMVPPFEAAAFSLTNNQISDAVTTTYGYHIIKLLDKVPAHKLALTDKPPGGDMTLSEYVKNSLAQQKMSLIAPAYLEKLTKAAGVEILDSKLKAATPSSGTSASPVTP